MKRKNHNFYTKDDKDVAPPTIFDKNGEVKIQLCKICHGTKPYLPTKCPGRPMTYFEMDKIECKELDF